MDKVTNPWTGKAKQKGEGMLNSLIDKHFPEVVAREETSPPMVEEKLKRKVFERLKKTNNINEYKEIFNVKERIDKLNQIINWID